MLLRGSSGGCRLRHCLLHECRLPGRVKPVLCCIGQVRVLLLLLLLWRRQRLRQALAGMSASPVCTSQIRQAAAVALP